MLASTRNLISGRSPYEGRWKGERGPLLRAVAFRLLYRVLPNSKACPPCGVPPVEERCAPLWSCSRNSYAMETKAAAGISHHAKRACRPYVNGQVLSVQMWGLHTGRLCFCYYCRVQMCGRSQSLVEFSSPCVWLGKPFWGCPWHDSSGDRPAEVEGFCDAAHWFLGFSFSIKYIFPASK